MPISALARPTSAIFTVFSLVSLNGISNNIQKREITVNISLFLSEQKMVELRG